MRIPLRGLSHQLSILHSVSITAFAAMTFAIPDGVLAQEEIGFTAEHMIEAQMDARYSALPEIEMQADDRRMRIDLGYMAASGGVTKSSAAMFGVQSFRPISSDPRWALGVGGFLDLIRFDGAPGTVSIDPNFASDLPFAVPLQAEALDVSGDALHAGLSLSVARHVSERWAWQVGVALEYYEIDAFRVAFSASAPNGFDGELDYAGNYNSITPYLTFRHLYPRRSERFIFSSRFLIAWPLPRRGFRGRVSGPGFSVDGDSKAAGQGRHIPDGFAGVGFAVEGAERGWRIDVGASLWLFLAEDKGHEGVDPPLFVHFNLPIN
jgi:hypothetical protein